MAQMEKSLTIKCMVCGDPAPWIYKNKVPLCSKHYHERHNGTIFIIEIRKGLNMNRVLEKAFLEDYTGQMAMVPVLEMKRHLGFKRIDSVAIIYVQKPMFEELINSLYHDEPKKIG